MTENDRKNRNRHENGESPVVRRIGRRNLTDAESPSLIPSESCKPMDDEERRLNDKFERSITRYQSQLIETFLDAADNNATISPDTRAQFTNTAVLIYQFANQDAADHGVTISPYTRDRLTNTSVMIYQFANKILPLKEEP